MKNETVMISDHLIWFSHITDNVLRDHLDALKPREVINLEADGVVGRWLRMENGKDGRPTPGIKPEGPMKTIWNEWFRTRKGERIELRPVQLADDFLKAGGKTFSTEWESPEDEKAFADL